MVPCIGDILAIMALGVAYGVWWYSCQCVDVIVLCEGSCCG